MFTLDADIAVPAALPADASDIRERLARHGFTEEYVSTDRPPAIHYCLGGEPSGFYAEFITPRIGSEYDRREKRRATTEVAGVISQQLRHIELLLRHPWAIDVELGASNVRIQIANPMSFVAQKVLIHRRRQREDRAKDILYIHDTLEMFGARLPELRELWHEHLKPQIQVRHAARVSKAASVLFGSLSDDVRRAAEIAGDRSLAPEDVRAACNYGLIQLFG